MPRSNASRETEVRLRRARTILLYWNQGQLVFENYRTRVSISADPLTVQVLHFFDQWRQPEQLLLKMAKYSPGSVRATLQQLAEQTMLVREGTADARQDALLAQVWSGWLPHGSFHFGSKDMKFTRRGNLLRAYLAESRPPPSFKTYRTAPRLPLPQPPVSDAEFPRVLLRRKTYREFSSRQVPLDVVSKLLFYTWGVMGFLPTTLGRLPHKTSPSGGARHPGEVYLVPLRVEGLAPGLYHYNPRGHYLTQLHQGEMRSKAVEYCAGQTYVREAGALFLMTAVLPRSMWKYRFARAYRVVLLDAGHLCQTFCLTATWLGLAPFCTAALHDSLIEKDLGIDGISEVALYAAGVGTVRA
jgi:SagB-type dehydrogenase family enzyme